MAGELLEGAMVTLKRIGVSRVKKLHERMQERDLHIEAGLYNPPSLEDLKSDLADEALWIWEMIPESGDDELVGYAGIVTYSGPIYIFIYFFDPAATDLDLAQDAMLMLVHGYFQNSEGEQLWTYQPKPINEEIHDRLIEGGFDFWDEDVPGIDREKTASYIMERHTYDAYYGEGSEGYEQLDDDDY